METKHIRDKHHLPALWPIPMTSKTLMVSLDFCPSPACYSGLAHCSPIRICHPVSRGPTSTNTTFIFLSILGGSSPHSLLSLFKSHLFFTKLPPPEIFPGCSSPWRQPHSESVSCGLSASSFHCTVFWQLLNSCQGRYSHGLFCLFVCLHNLSISS